MKRTGSMPCHCRWLGSKLKPNASRRPTASRARAAVTMSKAISVGCTSSAKRTPHSSNTSRMGFQSSAKRSNPASIVSRLTGGNAYSRCQMGEPVKPQATGTPMFRAARAVFFMASTAQARFASGSPASASGANASERASFGSQTSCPARWFEIAQQPRFCSCSSSRRPAQ